MRALDVIQKKRDGHILSREEIAFLIAGYTRGEIPDHQMAAFCMAVYFNSMTAKEIFDLTWSMADSGARLDLSSFEGFIADKHSTGGVGDKTSLVLVPLIASAGLYMAKLSGRGLGHTGGTIDKLESISGFRAGLNTQEFMRLLKRSRLAIAESTESIAPADKKLYALRDVTATVDSIPLIAASVMSKKLAVGSDGIVLDVKVGEGAFMKGLRDAKALAEAMVSIGKRAGRKMAALVTDMSQPLGYMVGNALEVREAIETLKGHGPPDLIELCLSLGAELLLMAGEAKDIKAAKGLLMRKLRSGEALKKFAEMIENQGGDPRVIEDPKRLPQAKQKIAIRATKSGYVQKLDALAIGQAAHLLGAGRSVKGERIDHAVGVKLCKKVGDRVEREEPLAYLHVNDCRNLVEARRRMEVAFEIGKWSPQKEKLIRARIL